MCFSVDTYKPNVAEYMVEAGVDVLNDVNGAKGSTMAEVAAKYDIPNLHHAQWWCRRRT